jgi:transcriptional regulator GlxA family with amidase domain
MTDKLAPKPPRGIDLAIAMASHRFGDSLSLSDLAAAAGMPQNTLNRKFHRRFGMSPIRWLWQFRTVLAAELIASEPEQTLTAIALKCGFNSSAHFSRRFRAMFRESPSAFRSSFRDKPRAYAPSIVRAVERTAQMIDAARAAHEA